MGDTRKRYQQAVETRGANAVAKQTGLPRSTVLSVVAGTAREGTMLLAEAREARLSDSTPPHRAA
jgi:hypothetical protein